MNCLGHTLGIESVLFGKVMNSTIEFEMSFLHPFGGGIGNVMKIALLQLFQGGSIPQSQCHFVGPTHPFFNKIKTGVAEDEENMGEQVK
jgi:hypothetical protein